MVRASMTAAPLLKKHRARSAWPMLLAMLSCVALVLGPAVIYLLPLFAVCGVLFFVTAGPVSRSARQGTGIAGHRRTAVWLCRP